MAEIAGLTLAVLPILMSAAQQYDNCLNPFSRYRKFAKEAYEYYKQIEIQKTIFRNHCRNVLEGVIDHETASCMLDSLASGRWVDHELDEKLSQLLGESLGAVIAVIELISARLRDVDEESERFKGIVEREKKVPNLSGQSHYVLTGFIL